MTRVVISRADAMALGELRYFTGRPCRRGHIAERATVNGTCFQCASEDQKAYYATDVGRRKFIERATKWKKQNSEKVRKLSREYARKYRTRFEVIERKGSDAFRKANREWQKTYRQKSESKLQRNANANARWADDVEFRIARGLRARLRLALKGKVKRGSAVDLLGCSIHEARKHIELQFKPGMTWKNWGVGINGAREWHVDHIRPLSSFDLTDPQQLAKACHYTNLQPLWSNDNICKGAKIQPLFLDIREHTFPPEMVRELAERLIVEQRSRPT